MALQYWLNDMAQGPFDDSPVRCEVVFRDSLKPEIQGTYPSQPLDGEALGPSWTNDDLCKALSKQLGVTVRNPVRVAVAPEPT